MIRFQSLGAVELTGADGAPCHSVLAQPRRLALLAYLTLAHPRGFHRRDTLLALFWPESDPTHAREALNQALHFLRRALGEGALPNRGVEEVAVSREALWCDALALEDAVRAGRLQEALELYRGDLLEGFNVSAAPEFERWLDVERERVRQAVAGAAWSLAAGAEREHNLAGAASWARRAAALTPYDEAAHRRLLEYLDGAGDRAGALQEHEAFRRRLKEELDSEPAPETAALVAQIRGRTAATAPLRSIAPSAPGGDAGPKAEDAAIGPPQDPASRETRRRRRVLLYAGLGVLLLAGVGSALYRRALAPTAARPRIAVLPLQDLAPPAERLPYLADGITEELINALGGIGSLEVVSRTSVMRYKGSVASIQRMAHELGVDYVVEATVLGVSDRIRVSVQLVDARTDRAVWTGTFDRELADALALAGEISHTMADSLLVALTPAERRQLVSAPRLNPTAYALYLRGREYLARPGPGDYRKFGPAIALFHQALAVDPHYAEAYAALAQAFEENAQAPPQIRYDSTLAMAHRALELDPRNTRARVALAELYSLAWRFGDAATEARRALVVNPSEATAMASLSWALAWQGELAQALHWAHAAARVDPGNFYVQHRMGDLYAALGDLERAAAAERRAVLLAPDYPAPAGDLAWILVMQGDTSQADALMRRLQRTAPDHPGSRSYVANHALHRKHPAEAYASAQGIRSAFLPSRTLGRVVAARGVGRRAEADSLLEVADQECRALRAAGLPDPLDEARVHALRGERDRAMALLQAMHAGGSTLAIPDWAANLLPLEGDPRFEKLHAEIQAQRARQRERAQREGWW